jgi:hypothetical protein
LEAHSNEDGPEGTYVAMLISESLVSRLGQTGSDVVGRISGVLLAGLAVQFIFNGMRQAALFAHQRPRSRCVSHSLQEIRTTASPASVVSIVEAASAGRP